MNDKLIAGPSESASGCDTELDIKTNKCVAYEMTSLAKQQPVLSDENPTYENLGHNNNIM